MKCLPLIVKIIFLTGFWCLTTSSHASSVANQDEISLLQAKQAYRGGDYTHALHLFNQLTERIEDEKSELNKLGKLETYQILGNVYLAYNDFHNSLKNYYNALKFCTTANDRLYLLSNISITLSHAGDRKRAEETNDQILHLELPDSMKAAAEYNHTINDAIIEKFFGSKEASAQGFRRALQTVESSGLPLRDKATPYSELYEYYDKAGMPDSAIYYLVRYDSIAQYFNMPQMMADSKRGMLRSYIQLGQRDQAIKAYDEYFAIVDSIYQPQQFIKISSRIFNDKDAKSASKIKDLELRISIQYLALGGMLIIAIIVGVFIWLRKRFKSFNRLIYVKDRKLSMLENELALENEVTQSRHGDLMNRIKDVMKDPSVICNPDFTLQQLAAMVDSNMKYVSQAINDTEGVNFRTYINTMRIQEARRMILDSENYGNLTMQAIAEAVGFKGVSNFYIFFKKVTGLTPSAYAKFTKSIDP